MLELGEIEAKAYSLAPPWMPPLHSSSLLLTELSLGEHILTYYSSSRFRLGSDMLESKHGALIAFVLPGCRRSCFLAVEVMCRIA